MASTPLYQPFSTPVIESGNRIMTLPWQGWVRAITAQVASGGSGGDVVGPGSSTDNAIARFDGTTGKLLQNSGITIADGATGTLSGTNTGDQNLFLTVAVSGQSDIVADSTTDTLTFAAGLNVTLTTDATTDTLTIASSGGGSWIPLVDGSEPPNFITDGAGVLMLVAYP